MVNGIGTSSEIQMALPIRCEPLAQRKIQVRQNEPSELVRLISSVARTTPSLLTPLEKRRNSGSGAESSMALGTWAFMCGIVGDGFALSVVCAPHVCQIVAAGLIAQAGEKRSIRSVMMPSVPSVFSRCAIHSSLTV